MDTFGDTDPRKMPMHLFYGAIKLDNDTAIRADITVQNYSVCPRHWYIDATFICDGCKQEFCFSATEQKYWYEALRFYVDSQPKKCKSCRQYERDRKAK